jgi:hypothetical protein
MTETQHWMAGWLSDSGSFAASNIELERPHSLLVTPDLWKLAITVIQKEHGPRAALLALTPISGPV